MTEGLINVPIELHPKDANPLVDALKKFENLGEDPRKVLVRAVDLYQKLCVYFHDKRELALLSSAYGRVTSRSLIEFAQHLETEAAKAKSPLMELSFKDLDVGL